MSTAEHPQVAKRLGTALAQLDRRNQAATIQR